MIVKFLKSKTGGGVGAVKYLLNEREKEGTAKVLQGDAELTKTIIRGINRKQKVTMGVLSFSKNEKLTQDQKYRIMESFEKMLLPQLSKEEYNILWVEHTDKGRLELNFVIPKTNLKNGKSIQPYYYARDLKKVDNWQNYINKQFVLDDPKAPKKEQSFSISYKNPFYKDLKKLNESLYRLVKDKKITNRKELIEYLKSKNIEITRESKSFISIKLEGMKKAVRFKGGIYKESFVSLDALEKIKKQGNIRTIEKDESLYKFIEQSLKQIEKEERALEKREEKQKKFIQKQLEEDILRMRALERILSLNKKRENLFKAMFGLSTIKDITNSIQKIEKKRNKEKEL